MVNVTTPGLYDQGRSAASHTPLPMKVATPRQGFLPVIRDFPFPQKFCLYSKHEKQQTDLPHFLVYRKTG